MDEGLARELESMSSRDDKAKHPHEWSPRGDHLVDQSIYERYHHDLYGILVGVCEGEALSILRGMERTEWSHDGFKAL
eukprot:4712794-Karenia_brevis.AAC.1